ncbi:inositol monophosphatase [Nostocoides sp. F2B08]|uniref:inositol monophosphatase family protein n=1 Tax=Nostocoides sp. F2B08 TaxID=2653936 RepID=UPI0012639591|nr:inositol monophosphatase family protein [Tetrasphaera sp. F2B08]KAB7742421.1 inositol monophosphatase [Tetrasphaera sp. F2B08]
MGTAPDRQDDPVHDVEVLRKIAVDVAVSAGRFIVDDRPVTLSVTTKTTDTDVVTDMDQRAQDLIVTALRERRPDDGFLGEEEGSTRTGRTGITWVVDPIDGTVNYLYGIPAYAVSIAAVVGDPQTTGGWRPVAGAVVNPVMGHTYSAAEGAGAQRIDASGRSMTLRVSDLSDLSQALVATGFGYAADRRAWQAAVLAGILPDIRDIRRMGSAALDLCRVAEGSVDAYYERGLNAWDLAAGWVIVTEAGGTVSGRSDAAPGSDLVVACGNALRAPFVERLERAMSECDVTSA